MSALRGTRREEQPRKRKSPLELEFYMRGKTVTRGVKTLPESWITIHVEGKPIGFMVDTGAQHSVLNQKLGTMSKKTSLVQGAMGTKRYCWTTERKVNLGTCQVSHSFLVIPECPAPLLRRDLLTKVNAQIHFDPGGMSVTDGLGQPIHALSLALRDEYRLFVPKPSEVIAQDIQLWVHKYPLAWAETAGMGLAKQRHPVVIELKAKVTPVRVRQYPMSQEAWWGITPHIRWLMDAGILKWCQSPWNTPLLPVKKPGSMDYRPVQDL